MKLTLNKEQLEHISHSIKKKGVNYTDVNAEMTDHIASEVEEEMERSGLEFAQALHLTFSKYGRFYFMKIEEEQQEKLEKQSGRAFRKGLFSFFTIPKIIFNICLFFWIYRLAILGYLDYIGYIYCLLFFIGFLILYSFKRKVLGKGKFLQLNKYHWIFSTITSFGAQLMIRLDILAENITVLGASIFVTFMFLVLLVGMELYLNTFTKLKKQYV
jgi:hypothetical protein